MEFPLRPTWAEISLSALQENYRAIKRSLTGGAQLMAVVKANAYGHGAVECARALESMDEGVDWFGVALVEEGVALRRAGIRGRILCVGGFWQEQGNALLEYDLTPVLYRDDQAEELNARAAAAGRCADFHLKVDTGMGRLGVPYREAVEFALALRGKSHLRLTGLMTHFSDADGEGETHTALQLARFKEVLAGLQSIGIDPAIRHLAASAGIHAYPASHGTLARAGAALYGLTRDVLTTRIPPLAVRPVMSLHARIVQLKAVPAGTPLGYGRSFHTTRESRIATLPIGYADGWRRALSNKGFVLLAGRRAPIVGRVSMDLTLIDVTDCPAAAFGETATLIGTSGTDRITSEDVAEQAGTISYEVVTGISSRVPRLYCNA
jgi:alanine racemase